MAMYDAVIFDNDGTFLDTEEGIHKSVNCALEEMGFAPLSRAQFLPFIGPPLQGSFMQHAGMTQQQAGQAIAIYRREYTGGNDRLLRIYPGMPELLRKLRAAGIKTAIASSKPTVFLENIITALGMRQMFDAVCGTELDRTESGKADIIQNAARQCGVPAERCLMVGDRRFDIEGAKALGMDSAGVLYGFGSRDELLQAGADFLAEDCTALEQIVFGNAKN